MNEVKYSAHAMVSLWSFLADDEFLDDRDTVRRLVAALTRGALLANRLMDPAREALIVLAHLHDSPHAEDIVIHDEEEGRSRKEKAWSVLLSTDIPEDFEFVFFGPLADEFGLREDRVAWPFRIHWHGYVDLAAFPSPVGVIMIRDGGLCVEDELTSLVPDIDDSSPAVSLVHFDVQYGSEWTKRQWDVSQLDDLPSYFHPSETTGMFNLRLHELFEYVNEAATVPTTADLFALASALGVTVTRTDDVGLGRSIVRPEVAGYLTSEIHLRKSLAPGLAAATLAHELGHVILHLPILVSKCLANDRCPSCPSASVKDQAEIEWEADWLAGAILIPPSMSFAISQGGLAPNVDPDTVSWPMPGLDTVDHKTAYGFRIWLVLTERLRQRESAVAAVYDEEVRRFRRLFEGSSGAATDVVSTDALALRLMSVVLERDTQKPSVLDDGPEIAYELEYALITHWLEIHR